eukprot:gene3030-3915_t
MPTTPLQPSFRTVLLTLGAALVLAACSKPAPPAEPVRSVKLLTVGTSGFESGYEFSGEVRARVESRLGFRVAGKIVRRQAELGQRVKAGQVLAELASQDLLLERRRRESELAQHENAYRAALAHNDRAQMVVSQSRAGEAQALLSLTDSQLERARIVAPFDGIVIKGDLSQSLGAPVQRGEVLLTLAPNDSFRLIVEVDEADIAAIRPGQTGELALAA